MTNALEKKTTKNYTKCTNKAKHCQ
uniref:Uncharacterized protein n=1 Tax=Anguilla anguilla TaxID=7936 RepID=A0A0E9TVX9_ANGAN